MSAAPLGSLYCAKMLLPADDLDLNRVALEQQVILFSCRQLAFADLGGDRPNVKVEDAA